MSGEINNDECPKHPDDKPTQAEILAMNVGELCDEVFDFKWLTNDSEAEIIEKLSLVIKDLDQSLHALAQDGTISPDQYSELSLPVKVDLRKVLGVV